MLTVLVIAAELTLTVSDSQVNIEFEVKAFDKGNTRTFVQRRFDFDVLDSNISPLKKIIRTLFFIIIQEYRA